MLGARSSLLRREVCRGRGRLLKARPVGAGRGMTQGGKQIEMTADVLKTSAKTGLIAGVFGSIVGVGGGVIMVPMMTCQPLSLQARHASATSLVAVVGTGLVSAVLYGLQGNVDAVGAGILASASMLTAPLGAKATMKINNNRLKAIMGMFLLLVAPAVPLKDHLLSQSNAKVDVKDSKKIDGSKDVKEKFTQGLVAANETRKEWYDSVLLELKKCPGFFALETNADRARYAASLVATGGAAGFLSGLLGIGGGMIVTPVLALTSGMGQTSVVGTSMVAMIFPSVVSLYTHHTLGNVKWGVGQILLLGSATGAFAGVHIANEAGDSGMKYIFAVGMAFLGGKSLKAALAAPK